MTKQFLLWLLVSISSYTIKAQLVLSPGNNLVQTGGYVVLQDMSLVNNGSFNATAGTVRFSGSSNNSVSGTASPAFYISEINKNTGNQLSLQQNISTQTIAAIQAGDAAEYNYTDVSGNSKSFYRLKLPAENNTISYSDIRLSACALVSGNAIMYPNPAINFLQLTLNNMPDKELSLVVYASGGQIVLQKNIYVSGTSATYTLPVTGFAPGVYHVTVQSPGYKKTFSFVKE